MPDYSDEYKKFSWWPKCPACKVMQWGAPRLVTSDGTELPWKWKYGLDTYVECKKCQYRLPMYAESPLAINKGAGHQSQTSPTQVPQSTKPDGVVVNVTSQVNKIPVASEEVHVPPGVRIKVKRSRTVEHSIQINWRIKGQIDAGITKIVTASIHGEIERLHGSNHRQSETIEYEVELDGNKSRSYRLTWFDVWRIGDAKLSKKRGIEVFPFEYRERAELQVIPI